MGKMRGFSTVKCRWIELKNMERGDPHINLQWHRFRADGSRLPPGFTAKVTARRSSLPFDDRLLDQIASVIKRLIEDHESYAWEEVGVSGIELVAMDAGRYAYSVPDHTSPGGIVEEMGGGVAAKYRRLDESGEPLPVWCQGELLYERRARDHIRVNHGTQENVTAPGQMALIMAKVEQIMHMADQLCAQLDGLEQVEGQ
ncbi:MAG: hypothetical protein AMJ93_16655 [Anaerolineae bacterium SM23_84]|nr:MAG: hypothetical protein AMJ93_16655 [Anaerolineae bacterium SM23_84]